MSRRYIAVSLLLGMFAWPMLVHAEMSSPNFQIRWDTVGTGGSDTSSSATYQLRDTVGNAAIGGAESATYEVGAGYRQGVFDQVITFDVMAQNRASGRAATARVGTTVTTGTAGLAVDDFVVVIQDEGASQVSAVGQIIAVGVGTITLDELKDGGVAPTIDGTNDFVYEVTGTTADFGELDEAVVSTSVVMFNATVDVDGGYVVQVYGDGNLRDGAQFINNVADGTVTTGDEEYGGRSSDTTLAGSTFDTADTAFSTSFQDVADESTYGFERRNFVTLKASINGSTPNGTYAQQLSFIVSGNF